MANYTLIEEIEPTPISEEKAKAIAKPISWISGGIGALIGGKILVVHSAAHLEDASENLLAAA